MSTPKKQTTSEEPKKQETSEEPKEVAEQSKFLVSAVNKLFQETFEGEALKLDQREKDVTERERKMEENMKNQHSGSSVKIRVGEKLFYSAPSILTTYKDSYFSVMLATKVETEMVDDAYFIARSPKSFEYVLEFLTYGKILTPITDPGFKKLLEKDADFYMLDQLKEELKNVTIKENIIKQPPPLQTQAPILVSKFQSNQCGGSGNYWHWNKTLLDECKITSSGHTLTITQEGTYQIMVKVTCGNSNQGYYVAIYHNGNDVSQAYHCEGNCYQYNTWHLNDILQLKANDKIQIYQAYNGSPYNSHNANSLNFIKLK